MKQFIYTLLATVALLGSSCEPVIITENNPDVCFCFGKVTIETTENGATLEMVKPYITVDGIKDESARVSIIYWEALNEASITKLVDKAIDDGMPGIALTDHGNMFGIKEFINYVNKKNGGINGEIKDIKKRIKAIESGKDECDNPTIAIAECREKLKELEAKLFKPIIGCEMYVAPRRLHLKEGKPDSANYHLVIIKKNEKILTFYLLPLFCSINCGAGSRRNSISMGFLWCCWTKCKCNWLSELGCGW